MRKLAACALAAALPAATAYAQQKDIVAVVNGEPIPREYFERIMASSELSPDEAMQRFIVQVVVAQEARKLGYLEDPQVQRLLGMAEIEALSSAYVSKYFENTSIPDEEIRAEYDLFVESQEEAQEYLARHILVAEKDEATELIDDIDNDIEKFAEAAKEKSLDSQSGESGGVLDWAPPDVYVPEFKEALVALAPGEMTSDPVQSGFGWHIILLEDVREASVPAYDQLKDQVTENLLRIKFAEHLEELKNAAVVEEIEE